MTIKIPVLSKLKVGVGQEVFQTYNKLRRILLGAEIKSFGGLYRIEYARVDRGRSEKLLFLHGFADCKENFYDCAQLLVLNYDLIIPDLPGFGRSFRKKSETYDVGNYAKWIAELLIHEGWDKVHLMGNSLGGAIAIEFAATYPEFVKSLILLDPAGVVVPNTPSIYHEFMNDRVIFEIHTPMQFQYFLERVFHKVPMIPPAVREHLFHEFSRMSRWNKKILQDLLEGLTSMDDPRMDSVTLNRRLSSIEAKTLIIWGEHDSFFPPVTGHLIRSLIAKSSLIFLRDVGHSPQNEAPLKVASEVRAFLAKVR